MTARYHSSAPDRWVMPRLAALAACLAATACGPTAIEVADGGGNDGRTVELIAVAPDGTHLWRYNEGLSSVYFASSGTQRKVSCGKNCWRDEQVPTAEVQP